MEKRCSLCNKQFGKGERPDGIFGAWGLCKNCISEIKKISAFANNENYASYLEHQSAFLTKHKSSAVATQIVDKMNNAYGFRANELSEKIRRQADAETIRAEQEATIQMLREMPVTTTDLNCPYDVIAPIIVNTTNKGLFSSAFSKLAAKYSTSPYNKLIKKPDTESLANKEFGLGLLTFIDGNELFEGGVGQKNFDFAFYICIAEMKLRCAEMGGDAIVGMRMDYDLDTTNFAGFYIQMYGTAVKLKNK